ncbi:NADH:flavin oxidoreductase/NADH oxidase [Scatolibacter rhodanostii]|uniref:NADH:flavin oxidoreductase/NADH oxidase n=1 Tax=Scatolibacter rhodanostii TaxID=2014781 RepID=UPI000C07E08A|nr:NADH:flavin oxidoreductase/NADH oxidase [Scatolibacter rhodanostii]
MNIFDSVTLKSLKLKNRIVMPPMCQFSVEKKDGIVNDWHFQHYVSRAVGGVGMIIIEMADVEPDGRISDLDLGLWSDDHVAPLKKIVEECQKYGAAVGIQIAHAGRKAQDADTPVAPSSIPFSADSKTPHALTTAETEAMVVKFQDAAKRAVQAGVDFVEIHGAHGYLIHEFQSPSMNKRDDKYGEDLSRFGTEIISAIKDVLPAEMPLLFRISAAEYLDGGYGIDYGIELAKKYKEAGVDVFHVSSGGESPKGPDNVFPGYQVSLAESIKNALDIPVITVGILEDPDIAQSVIQENKADFVAVGRGLLNDPYWVLHAAEHLSESIDIPKQYQRAFRLRK